MQYISTRNGMSPCSFTDTLLTGLAPDGGLTMPVSIPKISVQTLAGWRNLPYHQLAYQIMRLFIDDIPSDDLQTLLHNTYHETVFHDKDITPLNRLGNSELYLLSLSNGPSLAFKDMAMQFLGHVFEYVLSQRHSHINILGATSGDTGSAAEYAMIGKKNINVFMLSPHGRMSAFQQAQMYSLDEPNIFNIAVKGVFDDCQDLVKALNQDEAFKEKYKISAVNSINWARVLAQSVYYFKAYFALNLPEGEPVDFCVPSGNFGNIFAGYLAKTMGLPVNRLIVATNENDVLYDFFTTGVYRIRPAAAVAKTSSPSMDIGKASNFERYIYHISGGNAELTAKLWQQLAQDGQFDLSNTPLWSAVKASGFRAGKNNHAGRLDSIRSIYKQYNRLIDPHTADGIHVAEEYIASRRSTCPVICLETALPTKFAETVYEAVGITPPRPQRFAGIEQLPRKMTIMENNIQTLKHYIETQMS